MQTQDFTYKKGDNAEPLYAKVHWSSVSSYKDEGSKPIALILHGGGYVVGSNTMIPPAQISYLTSLNFVVVVPNYRLCPQVSAQDGAFADTASAMAWCKAELPSLLQSAHNISTDGTKIAAMGHSAGGSLALWLAAHPSPPRAIAAFYPGLYVSEPNSSMHEPYDGFGPMSDFNPTPENLAAVFHPEGKGEVNLQLSSFPLAFPGQPRLPRHEWMLTNLKHGTWLPAVQPDGNYAAIDPCTVFAAKAPVWPPTVFVQGDKDDVPGGGMASVERAVEDLGKKGARLVELLRVEGATHMFDMAPGAAMGEAVKSALDFLREHV